MKVSCITASPPCNYLLPQLSIFCNVPASTVSFGSRLLKSSSQGKVIISLPERCSKAMTFVFESNQVASLQDLPGKWEDPDDGSESEYDEEEEEVENDLDFESDWEKEEETSTTAAGVYEFTQIKYEQELLKDVEQLLEPEQLRILQQNATPDLSKISMEKWRPLHTLALSMHVPTMDKLLESGHDIDEVDKDGHTALHKAVIGKRESVISHLLRKNPHIRDQDGATLLHYAVQVGPLSVKLLIRYGVDVNVEDKEGWTPFHIAVQGRNRDIVKTLLVNNADRTRRTMFKYESTSYLKCKSQGTTPDRYAPLFSNGQELASLVVNSGLLNLSLKSILAAYAETSSTQSIVRHSS